PCRAYHARHGELAPWSSAAPTEHVHRDGTAGSADGLALAPPACLDGEAVLGPPGTRLRITPDTDVLARQEELAEHTGAAGSVAPVLGQAGEHQLLEALGQGCAEALRGRHRLGAEVLAADLDDRLPLEDVLAGQEEVAQGAERVEVALGVDAGRV